MIDRDPYVTIEQAVALGAGSRPTLYRRMDEGTIAWKPAEQTSANGAPDRLVRVASLPDQAQARYWGETLQPLTGGAGDAAPALDWTSIPERQAQKAMRRFGIVQQAIAIQEGPRGEQTVRLRELATTSGASMERLYSWLAAFKARGVPGLLPNYGQREGRYRKLSLLLQDFIKQQYLTERRASPMTVYERVKALCEEGSPKVAAPKYVTVLKFIKKEIPRAVADRHRLGARDFEKRHEYKCWRDVSDVPVGSWITGDHRVADVWVYKTSAKDSPLIRPWYSCYGDIRSRLIDGVVVDSPSSASIKLALRRWILQHGVPDHHYVDNGKDYRCHDLTGHVVEFGKAGMPPGTKEKLFVPGVLTKLGLQDHHAIPKKPWGKPIESWFKHVFTEWEKSLPGWCGNDPKDKPESMEHDIKAGRLLTMDEFAALAAEQMERWNQKAHGVLNGVSPASLWQGVKTLIPQPATLNLLLLKEDRAKVQKNTIRAFGRVYYHEDLWKHTGGWVGFFYDPANLGELIVMANGQRVCNAVNDEAMKYGASEEAFKELARKKRAQREATKAWPEHQRMIYRPEEVLAEVSAQVRDRKVRQIRPDPIPRPGTIVTRRILPGLDQAAASAERSTQAQRAVRSTQPASRASVAVKPEPDFMRELLEDN